MTWCLNSTKLSSLLAICSGGWQPVDLHRLFSLPAILTLESALSFLLLTPLAWQPLLSPLSGRFALA